MSSTKGQTLPPQGCRVAFGARLRHTSPRRAGRRGRRRFVAGNVTFNEPTFLQLIAMGDGLMQVGDHVMASKVYATALRRARGPQLRATRMRIGITSFPQKAKLHLDLLRT